LPPEPKKWPKNQTEGKQPNQKTMSAADELFIVKMAEAEASGTLSPEALLELQARENADPEFAQAYQEYFHTINSLQDSGKRNRYRALLKDIHADTQAKQVPLLKRVLKLQPKHWKTAAMAASVALLTSVITVWSVQQNQHHTVPATVQLERRIDAIQKKQTETDKTIRQIQVTTEPTAPAPASNYSGTGFALSNDGYLVTNYHVVEGAESLHILTRNGKSYTASVIASEPFNDIALLQIDDENFRFSKKSDLPYSFLASKAPLGASVYTLGFPQDEIVYNEGYISSRNGYQGDSNQYRLEIPAGPGQSGAPVVDASGTIIGIINSKDPQPISSTYAISSKTLLRLLRDIPRDKRPKLPTGNHLSGLSRQDQIEQLQDFTCMVQVYKK